MVQFASALDSSIETQQIVGKIVASDAPAVKELWERLCETSVDIEEAEALAGGDVVLLDEAKTAFALTQGLAVGLTVKELLEAASIKLAEGGTRQEAMRAVCDVLSLSKNTVVATLASELREEV